MTHIVFFRSDSGGAVAADAAKVDPVVACKAGVAERRANLQLNAAVGDIILADVLDHATTRRTQIKDKLKLTEARVGERESATAGAREIGVDCVSGSRERPVWNFRDGAGVIGVSSDVAESSISIGRYTPDARDGTTGAAAGEQEGEVAVEICIARGNAGLRHGISNRESV